MGEILADPLHLVNKTSVNVILTLNLLYVKVVSGNLAKFNKETEMSDKITAHFVCDVTRVVGPSAFLQSGVTFQFPKETLDRKTGFGFMISVAIEEAKKELRGLTTDPIEHFEFRVSSFQIMP
jgi:predicted glycosyltransferase